MNTLDAVNQGMTVIPLELVSLKNRIGGGNFGEVWAGK